ncbi:MAG: hypothetical protein WCY37_04965 [Candidatus Dojkabacteria bacterium]
MESKIEKLRLVNHDLLLDYDRIEGKINEIIDHLNSQAQPEENEEWEKRFIRTFGYWGEEIKFIKQLLKEREKEASEEVVRDLIKKIEDAHCDSISLELLKDII